VSSLSSAGSVCGVGKVLYGLEIILVVVTLLQEYTPEEPQRSKTSQS
jgi:hypothetical protein